MSQDTYRTIETPSEGLFTDKRSKFISFALPVTSVEQAMEILSIYRKKFYDARHICWAYRLGSQGELYRFNDDGEPSGTAGKPIYGQLLSYDLTDIMVLVVRYFGGVKLGTGGLIVAYRNATISALEIVNVIEKIVNSEIIVNFAYELLGEVMRIVKDFDAKITEQDFRENCRIKLSVRMDNEVPIRNKLESIYGIALEE
ncbi:YigZ family protein [Porphyromonas pogonae]|uniref:IMPACT family protein n=1 Tax=Porphyromonas pogonae TaxID=867595 RepID=UPI002E76A41D|nr:YigZ family protein [Porphyromonas pogonae]